MKTAQRTYTLKRSEHHAAPPRRVRYPASASLVLRTGCPSANRFQFGIRALEDQLSLGQDDELRHEALEILKQVSRHNDRPIFGELTEEGSHPNPWCRVEAYRRLIKQ